MRPQVETDFTATLGSTINRKNSPSFGVGDRFKNRRGTRKYTNTFSQVFDLKKCVFSNLDDVPPPNTYTLKTCFDGESPTIRKNHLTTSFKNQSSRDAHNSIGKSPKLAKPGPGTY